MKVSRRRCCSFARRQVVQSLTVRSRTRVYGKNTQPRWYTTDVNEDNPKILVTGSKGQIGTELVDLLRKKYGQYNVIASDVKMGGKEDQPYAYGNVLNKSNLERLVVNNNIDWVVHNASILSAMGEQHPDLALDINVNGLNNILSIAQVYGLRVYAPSSIAAFGPTTPKDHTPDLTIQRPSTMYGVTKVYLELIGEYFNSKYGLDFRALRYPGIISSVTEPGGGTTDYAVDIFYKAVTTKKFKCFLGPESRLPMMYMPDCLDATVQFIAAPNENLTQRVYNLGAIDFTPAELAESIKKFIPDFEIEYEPDFRQAIADSWPRSLDDSKAREDWGWEPKYDLDALVEEMLVKIEAKLRT